MTVTAVFVAALSTAVATGLGALPFAIIGFLAMTNPGYLHKFTESAMGYGMLAAVAVLMLMGGFWLKKTVAIKF